MVDLFEIDIKITLRYKVSIEKLNFLRLIHIEKSNKEKYDIQKIAYTILVRLTSVNKYSK